MSMLEVLGKQQVQGRNTMGRAPVYRLMVSGAPLEVNVLEATINLAEDTHDVAAMRVSSSDLTTTEGILEQPISFLYGSATKTEVFCGYVTELTEQKNDTGVLTWTMGMVGPTKPMQTGSPRFWTNRTIPSAVETLSYFSYLGFTSHAHDHVWPTLAQTNESDWQMIVSLAQRLGWAVYNRYGVVMLYDPLKLFMDNGIAAVLISETYTLAKDGLDEERALLEFEPVEEAESSTNQRGYKVAYFNDGTPQVAFQKGNHSGYRFLNDFVIRSAEEAAIYVDSHDHDSSEWSQTATARVMGNANLFPGLSVEVMTSNPKYYSGKFNGRWLIRGVQHKMDKQTFQSNLYLARPGDKVQVFTGAYQPFWQSMTKSRPTLSLSNTMSAQTPVAGLLPVIEDPEILPATWNGTWVSSWTNPTVRSVA